MSEKVKLTREQAKAIEKYRVNQENHLVNQLAEADDLVEWAKPLAELGIHEIMEALYNDYEVEPEFEVGDCVVLNDGKIVEIIAEESFTVVVAWIINGQMYRDQINKSLIKRHATKQEKWWAKHGRDVWELRRHDLISDKNGCSYTVNLIKEDYVEFVEFGMRKKTKEVKESFKVICFAEDRKDV